MTLITVWIWSWNQIYPRNGQKVLAAKKLIFLTNKNNELSAHRLFSATLQLCLNPKKHIPPQSILHEGKDSSSCKSPPSKCQHQPPCIQRKGPRRGRSLTRPNPQQQGTAAVGFQSKNTRGEIFLLCRKGSGIRLAAGPMVLTLFLKVLLALIQLSVTGLWSNLLEVSCMSNYHTCWGAKVN